MTSSPRSARSSGAPRAVRLVVGILTLAVPLLAAVTPASAYWSGTGSGSATSVTGTLAAPVDVTVPETSTPDVAVSWGQGAGGEAPEGYYVTRRTANSNDAACNSGPTQLISSTACTDAGVPDGEYVYVVTAVFRSWTATSPASGAVSVAGPSLLEFTSLVDDTEAGARILPAVTVAVETADGTPYAVAGVSVSVALGSNPSEGILSGETTATTDGDGVATFGTLSIDAPGSGYSLAASGVLLVPASSTSFDVTAPSLLGAARRYSVPAGINPTPVHLGSAGTYSVLAGTAVTSGGGTTMTGDLGVSPGTSVTGLPPGSFAGTLHAGDDVAAAAQADLLAALHDASSRAADIQIAGELAGRTYAMGVHHSTASLTLNGSVTLDGQGDPDAVFIFQTDAAFTTSAGSQVILINEAQASNVYWSVAGDVDMGEGSSVAGTILAGGSITLRSTTVLDGRALSRGAVNLDTITLTGVTPALGARVAPVTDPAAAQGDSPATTAATPPDTDPTPAPSGDASTTAIASPDPGPSASPSASEPRDPTQSASPDPTSSAPPVSTPSVTVSTPSAPPVPTPSTPVPAPSVTPVPTPSAPLVPTPSAPPVPTATQSSTPDPIPSPTPTDQGGLP